MFSITVESLKDFQTCARLYDYRHQDKLETPVYARELLSQRFESTLQKVVYFFFYKKQAGITPSYNALLNRWERLWFPKGTDAYDIAMEQHESWHGNLASCSNAATGNLMKFHEDFMSLNADPIVIDEKYHVPLTRTIRLDGSIDIVLRSGSSYSVIKWSAKQRRPAMGSLLADFSALRFAFEYRMRLRGARYYLYDLGSSKPGLIEVYPNDDDMNAFLFWAQELTEEKVFAPRRGLTSYCRGCEYDKPCSEWNEWPDERWSTL